MNAKVRVALAAVASCVLLHPNAASSGWFGPESYDECMVSEMRDQDRTMYGTVDRLCSKKFKREVRVFPSQEEMDWGYKMFTVTIVIKRKNAEHVITRGTFSFSEKSCEQTEGNKDFSVTKEARFDDDVANFLMDDLVPRCMKTLEVWGLYR